MIIMRHLLQNNAIPYYVVILQLSIADKTAFVDYHNPWFFILETLSYYVLTCKVNSIVVCSDVEQQLLSSKSRESNA